VQQSSNAVKEIGVVSGGRMALDGEQKRHGQAAHGTGAALHG
jgi:hypothetical protein